MEVHCRGDEFVKIGFLVKWLLIFLGVIILLTAVKGIVIIGIITLLVILFFSLRDNIRKGVDYMKRSIGNIFN